jgi:hypothetical protein
MAETEGGGRGKAEEPRYKGVGYIKDSKCWKALLYLAGKTVFLGVFNSQLEAAKQHDRCAALSLLLPLA